MNMKKLMMIVPLFCLLVACSGLQIKTPETTQEKINFSAATLTGLNRAVVDLSVQNLLTIAQVEEYLVEERKVSAMLRSSRLLLNTDEPKALDQWLLINSMLIELNRKYGGAK